MFIQVSIVNSSGGLTGKSDLILRFVTGRYIRDDDIIIELVYQKEVDVDGELCLLEIVDTAEQEQFVPMSDLYFKNNYYQGFMLVFGIDNRESFSHCMDTRSTICKVKGSEDVPIICELLCVH